MIRPFIIFFIMPFFMPLFIPLFIPLYAQSIPFDTHVDNLYKNLIQLKIRTLSEFIHHLSPEYFEESQYALFFKSNSIQPSNLIYPRVLLFGKDKHIRFGFNHNVDSSKSDLEILQFRKDLNIWELREIKFTENGPQLSEANPSLCISCHGDKEIRPEFEKTILRSNTFGLPLKSDSKDKIQKKDLEAFKERISKDILFSKLKKINAYLDTFTH
jgi:hypothetical protein